MDDYVPTMTEVEDEGDFDNDTMNLTREVLKAYVDDDGLRAFLTRERYLMMPFVKYVSFNNDGMLRLLCCGACPGCPTPHICNVCNIQFC